MKKGNGCSTFLLIVLFILIILIVVYILPPEMLEGNPIGTARNAAANFLINLAKPFTLSLGGIGEGIGNIFSNFRLGGS